MGRSTQIQIPTLLRIKANTLHKLGKYLRRNDFHRVAVFYGEGMRELLGEKVDISLDSSEIRVVRTEVLIMVPRCDLRDATPQHTSGQALSRHGWGQ